MSGRATVRVLAGVALLLGGAAALSPAHAAFIHEFPRAPVSVELHPRGDRPFTTDLLERALRQGVHAAELDLRWRASDSRVVCAHRRRDVGAAPPLEEALEPVLRRLSGAATVQGDGAQFFLFLDLKEESPQLHRGLVQVLAGWAGHLSNAAHPPSGPQPVTVVITGFRAALERTVPSATLDTLCVVEGRSYGSRLENRSGGDGRFQWVALPAPVERVRVRDLHAGRDRLVRGPANVRVVAGHGQLPRAIRSGADAVNANPEEIGEAMRLVASMRGTPRGR